MTDPSNKKIKVSVEVSATEVLQGTVEIKGTIAYLDDTIEFVYQSTNIVRQVSEETHIRVPVKDLQEIEYKRSKLSYKIILYPKRLGVMGTMPGVHSDKMVFQIKRKDNEVADAFVSLIKSKMYEMGETGMDSIPFKLADTDLGLTENSGLLYLDNEFLVFEILSGFSGVKRSESQIIKIEPSALEDVRLDHGRLKDVLYIKPKKAELLLAIPGKHKVEVKLKISKRHRRAAENLNGRLRHILHGGSALGNRPES